MILTSGGVVYDKRPWQDSNLHRRSPPALYQLSYMESCQGLDTEICTT